MSITVKMYYTDYVKHSYYLVHFKQKSSNLSEFIVTKLEIQKQRWCCRVNIRLIILA